MRIPYIPVALTAADHRTCTNNACVKLPAAMACRRNIYVQLQHPLVWPNVQQPGKAGEMVGAHPALLAAEALQLSAIASLLVLVLGVLQAEKRRMWLRSDV